LAFQRSAVLISTETRCCPTLSTLSCIHNHFQLGRHRLTADQQRAARNAAFRTWREVAGFASAA
jgi:hypothetical protein